MTKIKRINGVKKMTELNKNKNLFDEILKLTDNDVLLTHLILDIGKELIKEHGVTKYIDRNYKKYYDEYVKHLNNNNLNIFELQFILIMLKDSIDSYKRKKLKEE